MKNFSKILYYSSISLFCIRIINLTFMYLLNDTEFMRTIVNDKLHHYHYGILLLIIFLVLRKRYKISIVIPLAIAVSGILDEYSIIYYEFLHRVPPFLYGTKEDNAIIGILILILFFSSKLISYHKLEILISKIKLKLYY